MLYAYAVDEDEIIAFTMGNRFPARSVLVALGLPVAEVPPPPLGWLGRLAQLRLECLEAVEQA